MKLYSLNKTGLFIISLSIIFINSLAFTQMKNDPAIQRVGEFEVINTNVPSGYKTVASELIQTLLIDNFESAGEWSVFMSSDYGFAYAQERWGSPNQLASEKNKKVLGIKVEFLKRDWSWISIEPARKIRIKGITKLISVWVVGRNYKHKLGIFFSDYINRLRYLEAERLTWIGWKQVIINIPDTIEQENYKVSEERGLTFLGFRINFEPDDIYSGPFYTYFDYLTADVDLFNEKNQNPDDMIDNW